MENKGYTSDSSSENEPLSKFARRTDDSSDDEPLATKQKAWALDEPLDDSDNDPDYRIAKEDLASSDSNLNDSETEVQPKTKAFPSLLHGTMQSMPEKEVPGLPSTSSSMSPAPEPAIFLPAHQSSPVAGPSGLQLPASQTSEPGPSILSPIRPDHTLSLVSDTSVHPSDDASTSINELASSVFDTPKKLTRKRQRDPTKWKKNVRKSLYGSGLSYVSVKGKEMPAREVKPNTCLNCKFKCSEKVTEERREALHKDYWGIQQRERKYDFICQFVTESKPERQKKTRKMASRKYYFPNDDGTARIRVCKSFFLKTLDISDQSVNGPLKKQRTGLIQSSVDSRGKHIPHNKTSDISLKAVRDHIESFPSLESHYCRKDSKRRYLDASLNVKLMYRLYEEQMGTLGMATVSLQVYRRVFNTEYNLSFHKPKKDQCQRCRYFERTKNPTEHDKREYEAHQQRKKDIRAHKAADKEKAKSDPTFVACTFDLEKVLQAPSGLVGPLYFKRKLNCYNLCIYSLGDNKGYCYFWNETTGQKASSEVATILMKYVTSLPENVSHVTFYCDTCGGQNRNAAVVSAFNYVLRTLNNIVTIDLKFMESGHSQMEVDSMHAAIERQKSLTELFVPTELTNIFRTARSGNPYAVTVMKHSDFLDFKTFAKENLKNTKKDMAGRQIQWLKTKVFHFERDEPDMVFFKENVTDDVFRQMKVTKKTQRGRSSDEVAPQQKYAHKLSISATKKRDLMSLCATGVIPDEFVPFFESLTTENGIKETTHTRDVEDDSTDEDDMN